jgi:hypothetical protein
VTTNLRPTDFPFGWRGLVLNRHRTAAGAYDRTYENSTIRVDRFDYSRLQVRDQREPLNVMSGGDLGDATETFRYLSLGGSIIAPTGSELEDALAEFLSSFDIEEAILASPSTKGVSALTFTCPTDIATYTPYQVEKFMARPAGYPVITERRSTGLALPFALELVCEDPRRYRNTATSKVLSSGGGWSQACPNWNAAVGRLVYPTVTIAMAGVGSATLAISDGTRTLIISANLLVNADVVVVNMANGRILKNGVDAAFLRTSAVDTYFGIPRGGVTVTASNTTNVTSITVAYNEARA